MPDANGNEPNYPIQSVSRALSLLLRLRTQPTLSVSEASDYLGVSRSTAHRSLAMLLQHDFVRQDTRTKLYEAGPALLQIGLAAVARLDVRTIAQPYVHKLAELTRETVHLVMLSGRDVLFLDGVESNRAVRSGLRIGVMVPAHTTAGGKSILATLAPDRLRALYPGGHLDVVNERSINSLEDLERDLALVRQRGYATNDEESEDGLRAVAASVTDGNRILRVMPALTVGGPKDRFTPERIEEIGQIVIRYSGLLRDELIHGDRG
ncbi:IclR family transcriptional regulator [Dactylosporangium sp. CA-092794]|uniref:IclR family transcriptional regulator n=1 Tax=Dactylosporangium sp. CA-092794 TaxID=3239929 RepID=UPI003D8C7C3A